MNVHKPDTQLKQWLQWGSLLVGLWLAASPVLLGYSDPPGRMLYNSVVVGLAIALVSGANLLKEDRWEPMANLLLGLWAIASPWVFHFWSIRSMAFSTVLCGAYVVIVSLLQVADRYDLDKRLPQ